MTGWPTGSPQKTPVGPSAPATPGTTAKPGSIFTSAKSFPIPLFQLFTVVPIAASVTRTVSVGSTRVPIWAMTVLPLPEQWPAVPMYFDVPSVKTKFIVHPLGETMQVPALTAVVETPSVAPDAGRGPRQTGLTGGSGPASGS